MDKRTRTLTPLGIDRSRVRSIQFSVHLPSLVPDAKRVNDRLFKALCPLHEDTRPSLYIRNVKDRGWRWACHVCNEYGDAADLLIKRDGVSFPEALAALDGGEALPAPPLERRYWRLLVCDCCGDERVELRDLAHLVELADSGGWEVAADDACAAVGPRCLALALQIH